MGRTALMKGHCPGTRWVHLVQAQIVKENFRRQAGHGLRWERNKAGSE